MAWWAVYHFPFSFEFPALSPPSSVCSEVTMAPPPWTTLTACTLLATTVNAQLQLTGDPLQDRVLTSLLHNKDGTQQYVLYDFRPAFPPYTKESLRELLLLPKDDGGEDDAEEQGNIQANETDGLSIDDRAGGVSDSVEEVREATVEQQTDSDAANLYATKEAALDEDVHTDVSASDVDEKILQGVQGEESTVSDEEVQHDQTSIEAERETDSTISSTADETPVSTFEESDEQSKHKEAEIVAESSEEMQLEEPTEKSEGQPSDDLDSSSTPDAAAHIDSNETETSDVPEVSTEDSSSSNLSEDAEASIDDTAAVLETDFDDKHKLDNEDSTDTSDGSALGDTVVDLPVDVETDQVNQHLDEIQPETPEGDDSQSLSETDLNNEYATEYSYSTLDTKDEFTQQETTDKITINYDDSPPQSNLQHKDEDANRQFVTGLDEVDKLFESVAPPDELDVGADGSSIQDVLVGQGLKILFKRAKSFGSSVKERFEKIVEKALPQQLVDLAGEHGKEDEESLEDILTMMKKGDLSLGEKEKGGAGDKTQQKEGTNKSEADEEFSNNERLNKLKERFPLLKTPRANKLFKYARRKWIQAKHLFDEILHIFGGDDDEDDFEFDSGDIMNFDNVRSLLDKNRLKVKESSEMPQFGSEVDDSFVRSRYDAMMKLNEKK